MTDQPSVEEARFMLDFAHEAAAQGDYDVASYTQARDAYAAAVRADILRRVREAVPAKRSHRSDCPANANLLEEPRVCTCRATQYNLAITRMTRALDRIAEDVG